VQARVSPLNLFSQGFFKANTKITTSGGIGSRNANQKKRSFFSISDRTEGIKLENMSSYKIPRGRSIFFIPLAKALLFIMIRMLSYRILVV